MSQEDKRQPKNTGAVLRQNLVGADIRQLNRAELLRRLELFKINIGFDDIPEINEISREANQYLYPLHLVYTDKIQDFTDGIFIADTKGIYVPIETGGYGVVHVERIPLGKPAVYGITDLTKSARIQVGNQTIIYVGLDNNRYGYIPSTEDSYIKPVLGLSFSQTHRLLMVKEGVKIEDQDDEEEEELEDWEN